jgi:hypothetical protein
MKTLFLIDGAAGDVKEGICRMLTASAYSRYFSKIKLIKKYSTRGSRGDYDDIFSDDESKESRWLKTMTTVGKKSTFENILKSRSNGIEYFCYRYPEISGCEDEYYLIDKEKINNTLEQDDCNMAILIVRNNKTMAELVEEYETKLGYNVVSVCIYLDKEYSNKFEVILKEIDKAKLGSCTFEDAMYLEQKKILDIKKNKLNKLNDFFFKQRGNYEETLVFSGKNNEEAMDNLALQFKEMIDATQKRDSDKIVVDSNHKYWLPRRIRHHRDEIHENIENYSKNIFVMMPFVGHDKLYETIKDAIEIDENSNYTEFKAIRADKKKICSDNDFENYWCCSFICKYGFAFFFNDSYDKDGKLDFNPNVAYEIGLMHQLGKTVYLFPEKGNNTKIDLFFDVKDRLFDEWSVNNDFETLKTKIRNIIVELKQIQSTTTGFL